MYKNCTVRCKLESDTIEINYSTGLQQGDNVSPVLFAYIMQAFLDTLKMMPKPSEFHHFKLPTNGNLKALNGRLMKQPTSSKGDPFEFNNVFFVDGSVFITDSLEDLESLAPNLIQHFKQLGLQMHVGSQKKLNTKLKQCFPQHHSKKQENSVPMEHYLQTSPSQTTSTSALHIASNTLAWS